eukprot:10627182-Lingulodinium_polyedra.AAC.1
MRTLCGGRTGSVAAWRRSGVRWAPAPAPPCCPAVCPCAESVEAAAFPPVWQWGQPLPLCHHPCGQG